MRGDEARSNTLLEESLVVFKDLGDSRGVAEVLLELGRVAHAQGNEERAASFCRESLVLSSKLDNKAHMAFCLTVLAGVIQATGDAARATRLFGAADMLLRSLDAVLDPGGSLEYESNLTGACAMEGFVKPLASTRTWYASLLLIASDNFAINEVGFAPTTTSSPMSPPIPTRATILLVLKDTGPVRVREYRYYVRT